MSVLVLSMQVLLTLARLYANEDEARAMDNPVFRRVETVLANYDTELLTIAGVMGVGIGLTEQGDQPAIHVYVNVDTGGMVPTAIPKRVQGVPVRIITTGEVQAQE